VQGCSCKAAEYHPEQLGEKKAEAPASKPPGTTARLNPR
jgi:hypothetical protein